MLHFLLLFSLFSSYLLGHTVKPAYLEIKSIGENNYTTKWKVPLIDTQMLSVFPVFPSICQEKLTYTHKDDTISFTSAVLNCKKTLLGESISIKHIETDMISVIFHFSEDNTYFFTELSPTHPSLLINSSSPTSQNTQNYIFSGVKHILLGYDHLLFVLGLLLLIRKVKILIQTITAFTLAHSITLGASALGFLAMPEVFIEILIALSIAILAVEILYLEKGKIGLSSKYPWSVALFFGLIHGFGFASVLSELTLPQEHFIKALLFFNLGIEIGQILFILLLISLYHLFKFLITDKYLIQGKILLAYSLGTIASFWFIERLISIFTY